MRFCVTSREWGAKGNFWVLWASPEEANKWADRGDGAAHVRHHLFFFSYPCSRPPCGAQYLRSDRSHVLAIIVRSRCGNSKRLGRSWDWHALPDTKLPSQSISPSEIGCYRVSTLIIFLRGTRKLLWFPPPKKSCPPSYWGWIWQI